MIASDTLCTYFYRTYNDKTYLFVELKNGDYIYAKQIPGYYVFEKVD